MSASVRSGDAPLGVAIVGCGFIAAAYVRTLADQPGIQLVGAYDALPERARTLAEAFDGDVFGSLEDVLADERVEAVVNLTIHHAHAAVVRQCLEAGRHVHSEKPLAMTYAEARDLVELAERRGVRLSCAPITFMGEAQQTAWRALREGRIGPVRLVYAEVDHGRIESWHPEPAPFYEVGVLFDVGVYPLTLLTAMFGPAERVQAVGRVLVPERTDLSGRPFRITKPDLWVATIDLPGGVVARLGANFYARSHSDHGHGLEFHGDDGAINLTDFQKFDAPVSIASYSGRYEPLPYVRPPFEGTEWGRGVVELADALREGRPQRATGAQAAHVVEIMTAMRTSTAAGGAPVELESSFDPPTPMTWAE